MDDVIRIKKDPYLHTSQTMWHDKKLSLKERGLLGTLLSVSYIPDWKYSIRGLQEMVPDGKAAIAAGMKDLEDHGYLVRVRCYKNGKFAGMKYFISDEPDFLDPKIVQREIDEYAKTAEKGVVLKPDFPCPENLPTGNPPAENPSAENKTQLINKRVNKEYLLEEDYTRVCEEIADETEKLVNSFKAIYGFDRIREEIEERYERLYGHVETAQLVIAVDEAAELMVRFVRNKKDFKTMETEITYKDMVRAFFNMTPIKTARVMQRLTEQDMDGVIGNKPKYLLAMLYNEGQLSC